MTDLPTGSTTVRGAARITLAPLAALPPEAERDQDWLGAAERARLALISVPRRRRQFLAGHWLAREMAAQYAGDARHSWEIATSSDGAPRLVSRDGMVTLSLSISHCADWVACAVAAQAIGLDLEVSRRPRRWLGLAEQVFSPQECQRLRTLPMEALESGFFLHWTIKEACGKRDGLGLRAEIARRQIAHECPRDQAQVITWQGSDRCLAAAIETGSNVEIEGWPAPASARYWRIEASD